MALLVPTEPRARLIGTYEEYENTTPYIIGTSYEAGNCKA